MAAGRETAFISDIQRFSTGDGPGIRTTVFFKGCNLRCLWCHNPETILPVKETLFYEKSCVKCGACEKYGICPNDAKKPCGAEISVREIVEAVMADKIYYDLSGGGVTFSGGEPLLQADFYAEAARLLKEQGVHIIADTAGNVRYSEFEKIIPYTDVFYYDVKCADAGDYEKFAGGNFELIYENLRRLVNDGAAVESRVPIIPGVNTSPDKAAKMAGLIAGAGVKKVWLLPYHELGTAKYNALGKTYEFIPHGEANMTKLTEIYGGFGLNVNIEN